MVLAAFVATPMPAQAAENDEQLVWIEVDNNEIPAFLNKGGNDGAILLLHGTDSSVTDQDLIAPLRSLLPGMGWDVLAIRLPTVRPESGGDKYLKLLQLQLQRLQAGIDFLDEAGYQSIALVGHGFGSFTALQAARNIEQPRFSSVVLVNIRWHSYPGGRDSVIFGIEEASVPVLDIASSQAHPQVVKNHARRKAATVVLASKRNNTESRHLVIPLKRQNMKDGGEIVARITSNWLNQQL